MADIGDAKHHKLDDLVNDDFRESEGHPEELSLEKAAILLSLIVQSCLFHYNNLNPPRVLNKELSDRTSCFTFLSHKEDTSLLKALQDAYQSGQYAPVRRLKILNAPTTPRNASSPLPKGRSPKTTEDQLKDRIEQFFTTISSTMKCYVRGERTLPKMERDAKHQDSTHIRDLEIPVLKGSSLLLHDLGRLSLNDAAATTRLSALFNPDSHIFMCNASGSGKTRVILEGLCVNWGLYFVCQVDSAGMGSSDLSQFMMELDITPGWVRKLPSREDPAFNDAVSVESRDRSAQTHTNTLRPSAHIPFFSANGQGGGWRSDGHTQALVVDATIISHATFFSTWRYLLDNSLQNTLGGNRYSNFRWY